MRRFYRLADRNGDGQVTGLEMLKFSRDNFAKYVDFVKVSRALNSADTNRNGKLSFYGKHKYFGICAKYKRTDCQTDKNFYLSL